MFLSQLSRDNEKRTNVGISSAEVGQVTDFVYNRIKRVSTNHPHHAANMESHKGMNMSKTTGSIECFCLCLILLSHAAAQPPLILEPVAGTYSIVAYDPLMQEWGVAVQSKFLGVGAGVPWAKAGVGAIATQAWANMTYGPKGLDLLSFGADASETLSILVNQDENKAHRQVGIVDRNGKADAWTGESCMPFAGHIIGDGYAVQGNILASKAVIEAMSDAFRNSEGPLGLRLIRVLQAAEAAGGDKRGRQSAALLVVREAAGYSGFDDRFIDLRVDDHPNPIMELERIYYLHELTFQSDAYIRTTIHALKNHNTALADRSMNRVVEILDKSPQNAQLFNAVAWELAIHNFRLDDALKYAHCAVELAPGDANIWDTLGEVHARLGQYEEAVRAEAHAIDLNKDSAEFKEKQKTWAARIEVKSNDSNAIPVETP